VLYLLDADVLIRADRLFYPPDRFPVFWSWLVHMGVSGKVKIPREQYEEVIRGSGNLVNWLKSEEVKEALLLGEEAHPALVAVVTLNGYGQLDETEVEKVGYDPFLISYGYADPSRRTIVTLEVSAPRRLRANRKIPDVCADVGVACCDLFQLINVLDFTTNWRPE
jgi:hypothetical protein